MPRAKNLSFLEFMPWLSIILVLLITFAFVLIDTTYYLAKIGFITVGIPVILASMLTIIKPHNFFNINYYDKFLLSREISGINLKLFFFMTYLLSIIILVSNSKRPIIYFLLIALLGAILLVEAIYLGSDLGFSPIILLSQILLVSLNLCLGVTLKYPLYFGGTDVLAYFNWINKILIKGFIFPEIGDYQYFPLFTLLNSIFTLIIGIGTQKCYYIVSFFLLSFLIVLIYLFSLEITNNKNISIMAALLFSFSQPVISSSLYFISSTFFFAIFFLLLYLLIIKISDIRLTLISIFLIIPLVLTHQMNLAISCSYLTFLLVIEKIFNYTKKISPRYILLFLVSFISYWIYLCGPFIDKVLSMVFATSEPVIIPTVEPRIMPSIWFTSLKYIDFMLIIFLVLIAGFMMIKQKKIKLMQIFGLNAIILLPLYIPFVSGIFSFLLGYRFPFYASPFIAIAASIGLYNTIQDLSSNKTLHPKTFSVILLIMVIGIFLSAPIMAAKSIDLEDFPDILGINDRLYFTQEELNSFIFYQAHLNNKSETFTDFYSYRYIQDYLSLRCSYSIDGLNLSQIDKASYFIFMKERYISAEKLTFDAGTNKARGISGPISKTWRLNIDPYPGNVWSSQDLIYNNEITEIYYRRA